MAAADRVNSTSSPAVPPQEAACTTTLKVIALIATLAIGAGLLMYFMRWTNFTAAVVTGSTGVALLALSLLGCCYAKSGSSAGVSTSTAALVAKPATAAALPPQSRSQEHEALFDYFKGIVEQGVKWKKDPAAAQAAGKTFLALRMEKKFPPVLQDINLELLIPVGALYDPASHAKRKAIYENIRAFLDANRFVPHFPSHLGEIAINLFVQRVRNVLPTYHCDDGNTFLDLVSRMVNGVNVDASSAHDHILKIAGFEETYIEETTLRDVMIRLDDVPAHQVARRAAIRIILEGLLFKVDCLDATPIEERPTTLNESFKRDIQALRDYLKGYVEDLLCLPDQTTDLSFIHDIELVFYRPLEESEKARTTAALKKLSSAENDKTLWLISAELSRFPKTPENQTQRTEIAQRLLEIFSTVNTDEVGLSEKFKTEVATMRDVIGEFQG